LQRPEWISESPLLTRAYALAEAAHRSQQRATDGRPFLDHVTEVGTLLHHAGFDEDLVASGLLHDAVERGTLTEDELRGEMGEEIAAVVLSLTEDATIESFADRKAALREQVAAVGGRALTVFAADKYSDILGLRRGIEAFGDSVEERMGTSVVSMAGHYRESVAMIESGGAGSVFLPALLTEIELLEADASLSVESPPAARDTAREWKRMQRARLTG
jgi:hypothetical protein